MRHDGCSSKKFWADKIHQNHLQITVGKFYLLIEERKSNPHINHCSLHKILFGGLLPAFLTLRLPHHFFYLLLCRSKASVSSVCFTVDSNVICFWFLSGIFHSIRDLRIHYCVLNSKLAHNSSCTCVHTALNAISNCSSTSFL